MARPRNANRKNTSIVLTKETEARLSKHKRIHNEVKGEHDITRRGNETAEHVINRILDEYEITHPPAVEPKTTWIKP